MGWQKLSNGVTMQCTLFRNMAHFAMPFGNALIRRTIKQQEERMWTWNRTPFEKMVCACWWRCLPWRSCPQYILKNIPAYERANEQLNQTSKKWQAEVEALNNEASTLYKNYQNEMMFLSQEQKKAKQEQIMNKEKAAADLKKRYFGPEGELFKKRESLMAPIQEEVYNAVKEVADYRGYSLVLDRSSDQGIIFGSPRIDISNEVLQRLGYNR